MIKYTKFKDVPKITIANYQIDVSWDYLKSNLQGYKETYNLDLKPDFQREHVWTEKQQIAYVEWALRGGKTGINILFNCAGWNRSGSMNDMVLVDGLQRITAAMRFLNNEIPVFGTLYDDYEDAFNWMATRFRFYINDLETREEVLQWYLDINTGGTDHTSEEIEKVHDLLKKEKE